MNHEVKDAVELVNNKNFRIINVISKQAIRIIEAN